MDSDKEEDRQPGGCSKPLPEGKCGEGSLLSAVVSSTSKDEHPKIISFSNILLGFLGSELMHPV